MKKVIFAFLRENEKHVIEACDSWNARIISISDPGEKYLHKNIMIEIENYSSLFGIGYTVAMLYNRDLNTKCSLTEPK